MTDRMISPLVATVWYSNSHDVVINDPSGLLAEGVSFDWSTFGLKITSTVAELIPEERTGW